MILLGGELLQQRGNNLIQGVVPHILIEDGEGVGGGCSDDGLIVTDGMADRTDQQGQIVVEDILKREQDNVKEEGEDRPWTCCR